MGLRFLIDEIKVSTDQDVSNVRAETKRQQAQMLADAKEQAVKIVEEGRKQGEDIVRREQVAIASAELRAKKIVADAKKQLLGQVHDEVRAGLKDVVSDRRYPQLFKKLADEASAEFGSDAVLQSNKDDAALAKKYGKLSSTIDCTGGVVVSSKDGLVRADNTLEAILDDSAEELAQAAYQELFGGPRLAKAPEASAKPAKTAKAGKKPKK